VTASWVEGQAAAPGNAAIARRASRITRRVEQTKMRGNHMTRLLLVQGANMSRLGTRSPSNYGNMFPAEFDAVLSGYAKEIGFDLEIFYTNIEGEAINRIYEAADRGVAGLLMNPGGFTRGGYALRGCIKEAGMPYVEIHCKAHTGPGAHSVTGESATGMVTGFGPDSYWVGLDAMKRLLAARSRK
jgi:3-dehydroquinate dehydratase-2